MLITRRLEFDAGHRIPNHKSQCRHLHGHRYAIEITLSGKVIETEGASNQGMVMDYSDVKVIAKREIVDLWDHAFLVWKQDRQMMEFLDSIPGHKTVVLDTPPTAENLARIAFTKLESAYREAGLELARVRLYETPNNWADAGSSA
ncbi:MAG: 6-carboxytetrahydropterin synthase QueD [Burkholderiales bacterium]|nr:6-carboxytetrahydropterin synthase QueD [Burkholderiales bacterium]